jgi:hypothetical protein
LYSNNSHFILNIISIMARFRPVGKKWPNTMAPAKLVPVNMRINRQVVAGSTGVSSGAAAGAASPVTAPADDTFVPLACSLGTKSPSGISVPSAIAASTAVSATATSSLAPICPILLPPLALQLLVSLQPRRVHRRPRNMQKDPFHLLLKPQPSPLPLPLLLSTLLTLHPSLMTLLPLRCNPFVNHLALLLKLLRLSFGTFYINSYILICVFFDCV